MKDFSPFCWGVIIVIGIIIAFRFWLKAKVTMTVINKVDARTIVWVIGIVVTGILLLDGVPGDEIIAIISTPVVASLFKPRKKEIED